MLASTVQFSNNNPTPPRHDPTEHHPRDTRLEAAGLEPGTARTRQQPPPHTPHRSSSSSEQPLIGARGWGPFPQDPTARLRPPPHPTPFPTRQAGGTRSRHEAGGRTGQRSTLEHHLRNR